MAIFVALNFQAFKFGSIIGELAFLTAKKKKVSALAAVNAVFYK